MSKTNLGEANLERADLRKVILSVTNLERLTELLQVVEQDERAAQLEKGLVHISTPLIP
ncbi:MAG: hypothetical protein BRC43_02830, partial [Cyanobacteria bacterium QS_3_48_167]